MLQRLYDWTMEMAAHPRARIALGAVSFAESSFFPIPPDVMLIPMVLAEKARAWGLALLTTLTSVAGGVAGYAIGFFLFDAIGTVIISTYGLEAAYTSFAAEYNEYGAWIVFVAGISPIPYKLITIASGATGLDLVVFIVASAASRGLRFFVIAGLLYFIGPPIRRFIEERLALVFTVFVILLFAGFVVIAYAF